LENIVIEAWSLSQCRDWLANEVLSGKCTYQQFLGRVSSWQIKQYAMNNNPPELSYADQSLQNIVQAAKELGLLDDAPTKKRTTILDAIKAQGDYASE
jgi:hypothetical protein